MYFLLSCLFLPWIVWYTAHVYWLQNVYYSVLMSDSLLPVRQTGIEQAVGKHYFVHCMTSIRSNWKAFIVVVIA